MLDQLRFLRNFAVPKQQRQRVEKTLARVAASHRAKSGPQAEAFHIQKQIPPGGCFRTFLSIAQGVVASGRKWPGQSAILDPQPEREGEFGNLRLLLLEFSSKN